MSELKSGIWKRIEEDSDEWKTYQMKLMCDCDQPDCGTLLVIQMDVYDTTTPMITMKAEGNTSTPCVWGEYQLNKYRYSNNATIRDRWESFFQVMKARVVAATKILFLGDAKTGFGQVTISKSTIDGWVAGLAEASEFYKEHEKVVHKKLEDIHNEEAN